MTGRGEKKKKERKRDKRQTGEEETSRITTTIKNKREKEQVMNDLSNWTEQEESWRLDRRTALFVLFVCSLEPPGGEGS